MTSWAQSRKSHLSVFWAHQASKTGCWRARSKYKTLETARNKITRFYIVSQTILFASAREKSETFFMTNGKANGKRATRRKVFRFLLFRKSLAITREGPTNFFCCGKSLCFECDFMSPRSGANFIHVEPKYTILFSGDGMRGAKEKEININHGKSALCMSSRIRLGNAA